MEEDGSLARLQGLQADLVAFSETRLPNLERLWVELEGSIDDFKRLLDKQKRSDQSRQALSGDKIKVGDNEYGINEDFRQEVIQVADALDLDELESARLFIACQDSAHVLDRPPALAAVLQFHAHRETLLDSLRLSVQQSADIDAEPEQREVFLQLVRLVVKDKDGASSVSSFWRKCVTSMEEIENWVRRLDERLQSISIIGQNLTGYALEALQYQKESLRRQHESLGAILTFLTKEAHATIDDYRFLMTKASALDRLDDLVLHYVPLLISCASHFGPPDGSAGLRDARSLDQTFSDKTDTTRWRLPDFRAAATAWWLAEYSGRYTDNPTGSPLQGVDIQKETDARDDRFLDALGDGAFQFMLMVCSKIHVDQWHDPAKAGLIAFLLGDTQASQETTLTASAYFQALVSEQLQLFVDALITNMPDTIRRLKFEEDEQRRNMGPQLPQAHQETTLHLERFLVIIAFAFEGSPEAAQEAFWSEPDGNMYGFLQWASKRQSTPRVAAFCEMFQAIAENEECAEAAQKFLLDETVAASSARLRKGASLSWAQIFAELGYYADRLREAPVLAYFQNEPGMAGQTNEPESALMLECYMRLASHMCRTSPSARLYLLSHQTFHLHDILFDLAKSGLDSRFKACAFTTLASMLTNKETNTRNAMWEVLDVWIFGIQPNKPGAPKSAANYSLIDSAMRLKPIAFGFEEPNAFVHMLQALVSPTHDQEPLADALPFPEQMSLAYRMPGIDTYIDFVMDDIFKKVLPELPDMDQIWELRCACLTFIATCLASFNEDLVVFANSTTINVDAVISTSSLASYVRLHPFARIMEWLFNDGVITALFASTHEDVDSISTARPDSPLITALCRSIEVIDLALRLQSTYFDIVRPIIKTQSATRSKQVANPTLASFEDAILMNTNIIVDLGLYCGTGHQELTVLSLSLLQRLSVSRKLANASTAYSGERAAGNRVLTALQQDNDVDRITAAFVAPLELDPRELEMGDQAPGFAIKAAILHLLNSSLDISPNKPGLAHCLLGFSCKDRSLSIASEGRFAKGVAVFHAVARFFAETINFDDSNSLPWLSLLRHECSEIIRKLLKAPLTSTIVSDQLFESGFYDAIAIGQKPISAMAHWAGRLTNDREFLLTESAQVFRNGLDEKAAFFEQGSMQLKSANERNSPTLRQKTMSSLLGLTNLASGDQIQNASIFDLFDFVDLDLATPFELPPTKYMTGLDLTAWRKNASDNSTSYNLVLIKELLLLRETELLKAGQLVEATSVQQCREEEETILACLQCQNQYSAIMASQQATLKAWVQLVTIMLRTGELDVAQQSNFILQALQIVLPKLDMNIIQESPRTLPLAKLVYALVQAQGSDSTNKPSKESSVANERLLHAFRTSLSGISSPSDSVELRETCYQIACHFLKATAIRSKGQANLSRHTAKMIDSAGERLIDTICEDALSSIGTCKVAGLMMLEACAHLHQVTKSSYMVRAMTRLNFVSVLVDSIRSIAAEFAQEDANKGMPYIRAMLVSC